MNLTRQPLADGFTACSARGDLTARTGKSIYGLRPCRPLGQPCPEEGHDCNRPALAVGRDCLFTGHIAQLRTASAGPRVVPISGK
jgi:hypothetical protein